MSTPRCEGEGQNADKSGQDFVTFCGCLLWMTPMKSSYNGCRRMPYAVVSVTNFFWCNFGLWKTIKCQWEYFQQHKTAELLSEMAKVTATKKNSPPPLSWIKKVRRAEVAIFPRTEQISDRIPTDSCNYRTKEIKRAQSFNFALKFPQNWSCQPAILHFWITIYMTSIRLPNSQKCRVGNCFPAPPLTAPPRRQSMQNHQLQDATRDAWELWKQRRRL